MTAYQKLFSSLEQLQFQLTQLSVTSQHQTQQLSSQFSQIESDIQQSISKTMEILDSSSKSLGFTLTIVSLSTPEGVEEQFDITAEFSVNYRNLKFTGNEKQVVANEEINEKFVLPILEGKQRVGVEVWKVERSGEQAGEGEKQKQTKEVFDSYEISLRDIIGLESEDNTYRLSAKSLQGKGVYLNYVIQVRGFAFDSWKKHHKEIDEEIVGQQESGDQTNNEQKEYRNERAEMRKSQFNKAFEHRKEILKETRLTSFSQNLSQLDEIMSLLGDI